MGTETQRVGACANRIVLEASTKARWERLSNLLKQTAVRRVLFLAGDAMALVSSLWAAETLVQHLFGMPEDALNRQNGTVFYVPFLLAVVFVFERNRSLGLRRPERDLELAVKGVSLAFLLLACANFAVFKTGFSRFLFVSWYLLALLAVLESRYGLRIAYGRLWAHEIGRRKTLLIGSAERLFEFQALLSIQRYRGYDLLGIVPAEGDSSAKLNGNSLPVLGSLDRWHDVARKHGAEQVVVAFDGSGQGTNGLASDVVKKCLAWGTDVQVYSELFSSRGFECELDEFSGFYRFFPARRWSKQIQLAAKKMLDLAAGVVGSLLTLLVFPVVALLIKIEDGGAVFYHTKFIGRDGSVQGCLKFRTMCCNADEILQNDPVLKPKFEEKYKLVHDPRVLRVGRFLRKFSIDELPQFFSVFSGRLSLVGPRIIAANQMSRYGDSLAKLLSVKPGLTGYWQVMGRQSTSYGVKVQMDMFYIDHWSIWLDLWIIARTFWTILRAEGAY